MRESKKINTSNIDLKPMIRFTKRWLHWETLSTISREGARHLIISLRKRVLKLIPHNAPNSLSKLLNGKSLMSTWESTWRDLKRSKQSSKRTKVTKRRNLTNSKLRSKKTPFTAHRWRDVSRLWKEWSFKMLITLSSMTTDTMRTKQRTKRSTIMDPSFQFGDFQLIREEERTLPQFAGIPNTKTYSLLDMDPMSS